MHASEQIAVRGDLSFGFPIPWDYAGMMPPPPGHPGSPGACKAILCMAASRAPALGTCRDVSSDSPQPQQSCEKTRVADTAPGAQTAPGPIK